MYYENTDGNNMRIIRFFNEDEEWRLLSTDNFWTAINISSIALNKGLKVGGIVMVFNEGYKMIYIGSVDQAYAHFMKLYDDENYK